MDVQVGEDGEHSWVGKDNFPSGAISTVVGREAGGDTRQLAVSLEQANVGPAFFGNDVVWPGSKLKSLRKIAGSRPGAATRPQRTAKRQALSARAS